MKLWQTGAYLVNGKLEENYSGSKEDGVKKTIAYYIKLY